MAARVDELREVGRREQAPGGCPEEARRAGANKAPDPKRRLPTRRVRGVGCRRRRTRPGGLRGPRAGGPVYGAIQYLADQARAKGGRTPSQACRGWVRETRPSRRTTRRSPAKWALGCGNRPPPSAAEPSSPWPLSFRPPGGSAPADHRRDRAARGLGQRRALTRAILRIVETACRQPLRTVSVGQRRLRVPARTTPSDDPWTWKSRTPSVPKISRPQRTAQERFIRPKSWS